MGKIDNADDLKTAIASLKRQVKQSEVIMAAQFSDKRAILRTLRSLIP
ncbi:hypothetical protein [Mucilaginibacter pedocola]|nr:hypothetical protein [Mucilaginibacter pedocola]